ncbi:hypothetical protein HQ529_05515 [Candidatus Woesearchaeota archaeon]|nr:hypothetical protein [Candidatus Woesearchaeota archaeon]
MEFNLTKIKFSNNDLKSGIKIPKILTKELAEFLGIMIGDGHIGKYKNKLGKNSYLHYEMNICGNIKDKNYYKTHVNNLFFEIFNTKFNFFTIKKKNAIILRKDSKAIYFFLSKIIGIPSRKDNVSIPSCILRGSKKVKSYFLKGFADADFCLTVKYKPNKYPVIHGTSKSKTLITQSSKNFK